MSVLARTAAELDGLAAREPAYAVWAGLQRQLHAMQQWSTTRDPTTEERARISIGLVAARELEPAADGVMEDLISRLHLLSYYWRHWPFAVTPPPLIKDRQVAKAAASPKLAKGLSPPPFPTTVILLISLALFAAACSVPALEFRSNGKSNDIMFGLRALTVGWSGIFAGVVAWYANPSWMLGLFFAYVRRPRLATAFAGLAILLASSTFSLVGRELPGDEGNVTRTTVVRLLPGCYLWMASMIVLPMVAVVREKTSRPPSWARMPET